MIRDDVADAVILNIVERQDYYYRLAYSFCGNSDDSMDAVSEMTLIVIEKYDSLRVSEAFVSWSSKILINICRKYLRRRKRSVYIDDLETEPAGGMGGDDRLSVDMEKAIASLKPIYREVFVLKELLEYTYDEIAASLRIPAGTVKSRYSYGLGCLRRKLGERYDEEI